MTLPIIIVLLFLWVSIWLIGSGFIYVLASSSLSPLYESDRKISGIEVVIRAVLFVSVICIFIVWCISNVKIAEMLVSWL